MTLLCDEAGGCDGGLLHVLSEFAHSVNVHCVPQ